MLHCHCLETTDETANPTMNMNDAMVHLTVIKCAILSEMGVIKMSTSASTCGSHGLERASDVNPGGVVDAALEEADYEGPCAVVEEATV